MFPKHHRLQLRQTLPYFSFDHKLHQSSFSIYWRLQNDTKLAQAAVVVSKKVSPKAVERNRLKRVIRATVSPLLSNLKKGTQVVVVVRRKNVEQDLQLLQSTIEKISK
jgi:ribonuclease P protein component